MTGSSFYITVPQLLEMQEKFAAAPELLSKVKTAALTKAAIQTQATVMTQVPIKTGTLRKSIRYLVDGSDRAVVYVDPSIKYAQAVEEGSGLFATASDAKHSVIEPVSKSVMATKMNPGWGSANSAGYFIIGKYQRGQEANPFMKRSLDIAKPIVMMTFKEATDLLKRQLAVQ